MLNRSEILRSAWAAYRLARPAIFAAGDTADKRTFLRPFFAKHLRAAWAKAKKAEAHAVANRETEETARRFIEAQNRVRLSLAASLSPETRSARMSAVRDEIELVDYAPLGVRAAHRRTDLGAELAALEAAGL